MKILDSKPKAAGRTRKVRKATVALACWVSGTVLAQATTQPTPELPGFFKAIVNAVSGAASSATPGTPQIAPGAGNPALRQALTPPPGSPMPRNLQALFAKGTVTGADLYETLKAIKQEARARRSAQAWSALNLAADRTAAQLQAGSMPDASKILGDAAFSFFEQQLKSMASTVGMQALDGFMQVLLEDTGGLASESITLPSAEGMTEVQGKRIVTMAALIVAARVSEKMLTKTEKDLSTLQVDYESLIKQRENAGSLLFALIDKRRNAQRGTDQDALARSEGDLKAALSYDDIRFIDQQLLSMKADAFAKDMAAQNLALKLLRQQNPNAFAEYNTKAKDVLDRSRSYLRTVSGVAAFGGLMLTFAQTAAEIGRENNVPNLLQALPLGIDFLKAAFPVAKVAVASTINGFVLQPSSIINDIFKTKKAFVVTNGDQREELFGASEVFATLEKAGVKDQFAGALFRNETAGWLTRVHECDAGETGRMIDATVPESNREKFASTYLGYKDNAKGFSFLNALTLPGNTPREKRLGEQLLGRDHRRSSNDESGSLGQVQAEVGNSFNKWGNVQLIRLAFANRDGASAAYATLEVGPVAVRPVPTADSVFVYESILEGCRKVELSQVAAPPDTPADKPSKPAPKPPAKPARR